MDGATVTIVINATREAAEAISQEIDTRAGGQSRVTERRNLDGDTAAWIVIANLGVQALPHLLKFIKPFLPSKQVKKIKWGDLEVENPTPELIERMLADPRLKGGEKGD